MKRSANAKGPKARTRTTKLKLENYMHPDRFGELLGYRLVRVEHSKNIAITALEIQEIHLSPAGRVHGGVVSAFFDYTAGAAVFTTLQPRDFCSTVELKVNYFRPIELGDELRAQVQVAFRGKRLCVAHGLVYRKGEKKPVAMGTATFNIVSQQR